MAITNIETHIGIFKSAQDLSTHQYKVVQLNSLNPGEVLWQLPSLQGTPQGVLCNAPRMGQVASVQVFGIAKCIVGGTQPIPAGRGLQVAEDGTVIEGGSFATSVSEGLPGEIISVLLGGSGVSLDGYPWSRILEGKVVKVPLNQQMHLHLSCDELYVVEGILLLDGDLILEE
jgi:hypothetical protein